MSYRLNKPYTDSQRADFVVKYAYDLGLKIEETDTTLFALEMNEVLKDGQPVQNKNYEQEQLQKEKEHIARLHLTRGDVFRALLQAKNITRTQLRQMIEDNNELDEVSKEMALIDFDEALEFYRGVALIDTIGNALGITSKQMDEFFQTNDYTKLLNEGNNTNA